jgi:hypothetical protein
VCKLVVTRFVNKWYNSVTKLKLNHILFWVSPFLLLHFTLSSFSSLCQLSSSHNNNHCDYVNVTFLHFISFMSYNFLTFIHTSCCFVYTQVIVFFFSFSCCWGLISFLLTTLEGQFWFLMYLTSWDSILPSDST